MLAIPYHRDRRVSVSGESMQPHLTGVQKIVIPKSDEQRARIRTATNGHFLFKHLNEDQYRDVVNAMAEKKVSAGTHVIDQGDEGDYFYAVESGCFDCYVNDELVTEYDNKGSFGELALMYNAPRAATIVAKTDGVLWALDRHTFRTILMNDTARKRHMYDEFLKEVPILKSLREEERHKIADSLETVSFKDQQVVVHQNEVGENFYLIVDGEALVYKSSDDGSPPRKVNRLGKSDYFGELALLNDKPRAATIVAQKHLKCATLDKNAFTRLLGPVVDILRRNSVNYQHILNLAAEEK
ncbi:cyclic nucleotide-binding-like protein [Radiomyces spectabilis]|uniref:cyclic nucleotide-binding-like protein n=1 Tax=Radiomyces spectabilis TaxID=64574 RepID=UPI00221E8B8A|nr:cyclic nucleotide-binding-like protein [Radiomyces spectabilis]KAI8388084.1 cyclic nucleotide-binding-like protein [Radiomyces spectabilis]